MTKTWRVRFKLQIHSGCSAASSKDYWLERVVEVPFVPAPGITLCDDEWAATIVHPRYDMRKREFVVWLEDKTLYNRDLSQVMPRLSETEKYAIFMEIIVADQSIGWQLDEEYNAYASKLWARDIESERKTQAT